MKLGLDTNVRHQRDDVRGCCNAFLRPRGIRISLDNGNHRSRETRCTSSVFIFCIHLGGRPVLIDLTAFCDLSRSYKVIIN